MAVTEIARPYEVVAEGLEFAEGPVALPDGSVVFVEIAGPRISQLMPDGKKRVVAEPGGGPNGAALGPDGKLYVCNSGGFLFIREHGHIRANGTPDDYSGGRIERVDIQSGKVEVLYTHCGAQKLMGPNDLVFDAHGGFYFSDLGKVRKRDQDRGAIYYAKIDGSFICEVAFPVSMANGVGLSPDGKTLYASETETARLWKWDIISPGVVAKAPLPSPNGGTPLYCSPRYQRFDSLAVEASGNICVATLVTGGISTISPQGELLEFVKLPDAHTTNICFGGRDLKTAYVTQAGIGQLLKLDWPRAGLDLNFNRWT